MTERTFRMVFGSALLAALYFDLHYIIIGLIALSLFKGMTSWRIAGLAMRLHPESAGSRPEAAAVTAKIDFEAERALSLMTALTLILSCVLFSAQLWFLPWFVGFAFFGAGLSGICPMVLGLRWIGLK